MGRAAGPNDWQEHRHCNFISDPVTERTCSTLLRSTAVECLEGGEEWRKTWDDLGREWKVKVENWCEKSNTLRSFIRERKRSLTLSQTVHCVLVRMVVVT